MKKAFGKQLRKSAEKKRGGGCMIFVSGTVNNAVKIMEMEHQWQQKKASGQPLSKKERNERKNWTQEQWLLQNFKEELECNRENEKLQRVMNKIAAGKELTSAEISYLEEKNPQALKEYEQIRAEEENYEKQLEHCQTKEEVDRLKLTKMGECLSAVRKISGDPYIPDSAKLAMLQGILGKANAIEQAHQEFVRSGRYAALPTEEEERREKEAEDEQTKAVTEAAAASAEAGASEAGETAEAGASEVGETAGASEAGEITAAAGASAEAAVTAETAGASEAGETAEAGASAETAEIAKTAEAAASAEAGETAETAASAASAGKEIHTAVPQNEVMASYEEVKQAVDAALKEQTGKEGHKGRRINQTI